MIFLLPLGCIMSLRKNPLVPGEYYHIYNRGNSKQIIFHDKADYDRFIKILFLSNGEESFKVHFIEKEIYDFNRGALLVNIGAYCLMPNHFHLLLTQTDNGSISKFMQKLTTSYSMYYNKRRERTGTLFEGKFKSEHVDNDRYLKYLFSYIHLNPLKLLEPKWKELGIKNKKKAIDFLKNYEFSSIKDYLGQDREKSIILNKKAFPDYFSTSKTFSSEIFNWITFKPK